jgi:DNA-binding MarR family transcriptional regulator
MKAEDRINNSLGFILYRTALALKSALQRAFKEEGFEVTAEQWNIIRHLYEEEGLSQREIGDKAAKDKPNVTRMLDALEKKGLLRRRPDSRDRRKYRLYLTPAGRDLHDRLFPLAQELRRRVRRHLSPEEADLLKGILNKIYQDFSRL